MALENAQDLVDEMKGFDESEDRDINEVELRIRTPVGGLLPNYEYKVVLDEIRDENDVLTKLYLLPVR